MAAGDGADTRSHCIKEVGHKGRHTYRRILPPTEGLN